MATISRADFVVKSVIIILLASSIYSWALIFDKYKLFKKINSTTDEFENKFWKARSAQSLTIIYLLNLRSNYAYISKSAMNELIKTKIQIFSCSNCQS